MKRKSLLYKCVFGIYLLNLMSCTDIDLNDVSKDVKMQESLVLPVGEGNITVGKLLNSLDSWKEYYQYNADSIIFETEKTKEYEYMGIDLIKNAVPALFTLQPASSTVPANTTIPLPGSNNLSLNIGLNPNSTSSRTDSAKISTAAIDVKISIAEIKDLIGNNIIPSDLKITAVFPKMHYFNSKSPITKDIPISQFGTATKLVISNFLIDFAGLTKIPFEIRVSTGNRNIKIGSNAKIDLDLKINQLDYTMAYGQYDPISMQPSVLRIPLAVLTDLPIGIRYVNPMVLITVQSYLGTYIRFNVEYVKALSKGRAITQASFNGNISTSEVINAKPVAPGLFAEKVLPKIDNNYGGVDKLFETDEVLDTIEYKFSVQRDNALNAASATPDFIFPGMKVKVIAKLQIPAYFKPKSKISVSDTIRNIGGVIEKIQQATLIFKITNSLPVKVVYSLAFLAEDGSIIPSSINDSTYVINSAMVNTLGLVTSPAETAFNISLSSEQTDQLKNAKSMVYTIKASAQDDSKSIQITKNNFFKVKLGVIAKTGYSTTIGSDNK